MNFYTCTAFDIYQRRLLEHATSVKETRKAAWGFFGLNFAIFCAFLFMSNGEPAFVPMMVVPFAASSLCLVCLVSTHYARQWYLRLTWGHLLSVNHYYKD